jgi:hypothetical protein
LLQILATYEAITPVHDEVVTSVATFEGGRAYAETTFATRNFAEFLFQALR